MVGWGEIGGEVANGWMVGVMGLVNGDERMIVKILINLITSNLINQRFALNRLVKFRFMKMCVI